MHRTVERVKVQSLCMILKILSEQELIGQEVIQPSWSAVCYGSMSVYSRYLDVPTLCTQTG